MKVNGEEVALASLNGRSLLDLISQYGFRAEAVAVEWNGTLPERAAWERIRLSDGDTVELIRFVGGG